MEQNNNQRSLTTGKLELRKLWSVPKAEFIYALFVEVRTQTAALNTETKEPDWDEIVKEELSFQTPQGYVGDEEWAKKTAEHFEIPFPEEEYKEGIEETQETEDTEEDTTEEEEQQIMSLNTILKQRGLMSLKEYDEMMQNQSFISTGYKEIDELINPEGGGFPRGCLSEVCGLSRSGKSRFVRDICLRSDVTALYIDTENALSTKEYNYMKTHGVDIVAEQMLENIWGIVNDAVEEELYDLIVVDSIGATDTQAERDDDNTLSMSTNVQRAKIMAKWLRGLGHILPPKKTAVVFVNHAKPAVGGFGGMSKPCGKSIDFHCMVQLRVSGSDSKSSITGGTKKPFNVVCTKTRYALSNQEVKLKIDLDPYKEIKELKD